VFVTIIDNANAQRRNEEVPLVSRFAPCKCTAEEKSRGTACCQARNYRQDHLRLLLKNDPTVDHYLPPSIVHPQRPSPPPTHPPFVIHATDSGTEQRIAMLDSEKLKKKKRKKKKKKKEEEDLRKAYTLLFRELAYFQNQRVLFCIIQIVRHELLHGRCAKVSRLEIEGPVLNLASCIDRCQALRTGEPEKSTERLLKRKEKNKKKITKNNAKEKCLLWHC
jgi:hypothetical protein